MKPILKVSIPQYVETGAIHLFEAWWRRWRRELCLHKSQYQKV